MGRFDDVVIINKIITVGFVVSTLNASAQLWQNHHAQIVVFQENSLIGTVLLFVQNFINDRVGINLS